MHKCPQGVVANMNRRLGAVLLAVCAFFTAPLLQGGEETVVMPDGTAFPFWNDRTAYRTTYHVSCRDPQASDTNPGTRQRPWKTVGRAAEMLYPGEKVIVHEGVYRECVSPRRGGNGPDGMIEYEAADGERVVITGGIVWRPQSLPSSGWNPPIKAAWMADLPVETFVGYNPFLARNIHEEFVTYRNDADAAKYLLRRGHIFVDGKPLQQVFRYEELAGRTGVFWVEEPGVRVHFRLPGDADPQKAAIEVTAREQAFSPRERGLGYVRVRGFCFQCGADGVPVPQRALLSTNRGHHWILENNEVRWANACGIDVGNQDWKAAKPAEYGRHIIRGNRVSDCGVCGIAGCMCVDQTLVEDNVVERVGGLEIEQMWEVAGLKFHTSQGVLLRRNTFRDMHQAAGIWLDYLNANCRVTGNRFFNIRSRNGALFVEVSHGANVLDNNVFWNIRPSADREPVDAKDGAAVSADTSSNLTVAQNFFGKVRAYAVCLDNFQASRNVGEHSGDCGANQVLNNIFFACPREIFLGRLKGNRCDGNLFDAGQKEGLFDVQDPVPDPKPRLKSWQAQFGQDRRSSVAAMEATLSVNDGSLRFSCGEIGEICVPVNRLGETAPPAGPGPFNAEQWILLRSGRTILRLD